MSMKTYLFWVCSIIVSPFSLLAQNETVFSINNYLESVKKNHPLAKVASLSVTGAEAEITSARGEFDPVIQYNNHQKTFNNTNYYYYNNAELKVPLPIGMDIKAGAEDNGGNYITREVTTGQTSYLGAEVAVLKGMLMDKRRAALQQAKIMAKQTQQQRNAAINDLLLDAVKQYWQWYSAFAQKKLYEKFLNIAQNRLHLMVIAYQQGDKALADTIEANAQVLNYIALLNDADVKLNKAILQLTDYLWDENEMPYVLPQNYVPDTTALLDYNVTVNLPELITSAINNHPEIKEYTFKLDGLEVERKLKWQNFLPTLNLKANLLNKGYNALYKVNDVAFLENNYKFGIDFKVPLFLRNARGDYKKTQIKIEQTQLNVTAKKWQLQNKISMYYNQNHLYAAQLQQINSLVNSFEILLRNELLKFNNGESSLFLINARESKLLETKQKLIELQTKLITSKYETEWAAGIIQ